MKKGISLIGLAVVIIVMVIILGVVVFSGADSAEYANINTFASEILNIQNAVDTYHLRYEKYPVTEDYILDTTTIADASLAQFASETITDNTINFKIVDLSAIGINSSQFQETLDPAQDDTELYVLSEATGKVYYIAGVEYETVMYYTLTDVLYELTGTNISKFVYEKDIKVYDAIFSVSKADWTNEPIVVQVKLPIGATLNSVTATESKSVSDAVTSNGYKVVTINATSTDKTGNYTINVNYTYNGVAKSATYSVTNFDNTAPTLSVTEDKENGLRKINVTSADTESGIKTIKYADSEIANMSFFEYNGKVLTGTEIALDENAEYTIYIEDNAGNTRILKPEVYAIYSAADNSLTFIRSGEVITTDSKYNNKEVTAVYTDFIDDAAYTETAQAPWYANRTNITSVMVEDRIKPNGISYWFSEFNNCATLDVAKIDTSNVNSTLRTFSSCGKSVKEKFNIIGLDNWDISKARNMGWTFADCGMSAKECDIGDLSKWNTKSATSFQSMFASAGKSAVKFDVGNLGNWKTSNVGRLDSMFYYAGNLAETWNIGDISEWEIKVKSLSSMFYYAGSNAKEFNIGNIGKWNTTGVTSMYNMFHDAGAKAETWYIGDLSNWDTSNVTNMANLFNSAGSSTKYWSIGDISKWNTSNVTTMGSMFRNAAQNSLEFNIGDISEKQVQREDGTTYTAWDVSKVESMYCMFSNAGRYSETWYIGDITNWDTSKVEIMTGMFGYVAENADLSIDLSGWDVSAVTAWNDFNPGAESKVTPPKFGVTTE